MMDKAFLSERSYPKIVTIALSFFIPSFFDLLRFHLPLLLHSISVLFLSPWLFPSPFLLSSSSHLLLFSFSFPLPAFSFPLLFISLSLALLFFFSSSSLAISFSYQLPFSRYLDQLPGLSWHSLFSTVVFHLLLFFS